MRFADETHVSLWFAVIASLLTLVGAVLWQLEFSLGTPLMIIAAAMMGYMAWGMQKPPSDRLDQHAATLDED